MLVCEEKNLKSVLAFLFWVLLMHETFLKKIYIDFLFCCLVDAWEHLINVFTLIFGFVVLLMHGSNNSKVVWHLLLLLC
jgi:hypothetical protein